MDKLEKNYPKLIRLNNAVENKRTPNKYRINFLIYFADIEQKNYYICELSYIKHAIGIILLTQ